MSPNVELLRNNLHECEDHGLAGVLVHVLRDVFRQQDFELFLEANAVGEVFTWQLVGVGTFGAKIDASEVGPTE